MFTKADLLEQYNSLPLKPLHLLRVEKFGRSTYPHIETESTYSIYRGLVTDFESAMQFYCNCIIEWDAEGQDFHTWEKSWQGWLSLGQMETVLCRPISKDEFYQQINTIFHIVRDLLPLPDSSDFVAALQTEDEWNDAGILAQFKHEYVYVQWHTTG